MIGHVRRTASNMSDAVTHPDSIGRTTPPYRGCPSDVRCHSGNDRAESSRAKLSREALRY